MSLVVPFLFASTTTSNITVPEPLPVVAPKPQNTLQEEVYRLANKYHQDPELALRIISCEGKLYGTANNKNYRNGVHWSTDWGPFQINDYYHEATAKKMGLDIYNRNDNLEYGFYLMSKQGLSPWNASRHCWQ